MPDFSIDLAKLADLLQLHDSAGFEGLIASARRALRSGFRVVIQHEYENAAPDVEKTITGLEELETWRKQITPIHLKRFECPECHNILRYMAEGEVRNRFKCYDPPGCGAIFRLSADIPALLMRFDPKGEPETPYPANER